jgi:ribosomal protein S27AE
MLTTKLLEKYEAAKVQVKQLRNGQFQKYKIISVEVGDPYIDPKNELCPKCGSQTIAGSGGGIECVNKKTCDWWFCY